MAKSESTKVFSLNTARSMRGILGDCLEDCILLGNDLVRDLSEFSWRIKSASDPAKIIIASKTGMLRRPNVLDSSMTKMSAIKLTVRSSQPKTLKEITSVSWLCWIEVIPSTNATIKNIFKRCLLGNDIEHQR